MTIIARGLRALVFSVSVLGASAFSAQAATEVQFWDQPWGPESYPKAAQKLVDEFNASQKDIHVNYRSVPWTNWYETYVTAIASNSAPDLSTGAGFMAAQFYSIDAIYPVDDLVKEMQADGTANDFLPGTLDAMKYDGHYVALPWQIDIRMMYYNKDLLASKNIAPPKTWDEMRADAKVLTSKGKYGLVSSGGNNAVHWVLSSTINNGGGLFDTKGKVELDKGKAKEALDFMAGFVKDGSLNPASAGYSDDDARGSFFRGEAAFILDGPGLTARAGDAKGIVEPLMPLASSGGAKGTIYWVNNVMVYKQSKHPKETLQFLKWYTAHQKTLWTEGGSCCVPVRKSFAEDPFFKKDRDIEFAVQNYVPIAKPMSAPVGGSFPQLNAIDGDGSLKTLGQKIWQGVPVEDAVKEAQVNLSKLMGQ